MAIQSVAENRGSFPVNRKPPQRARSLATIAHTIESHPRSLENRGRTYPGTLLKTALLGFLALSAGGTARAAVVGGDTLQLSNNSTTSCDGVQLDNLALATAALDGGTSNLRIFNSSQSVPPSIHYFACTETNVVPRSIGGYVVFGIDDQKRVTYQAFNASNGAGSVSTASTSTNTNILGLTSTRANRLVAAWWADGYIRQRLFIDNAALTPSGASETNLIPVSNPTRPYLFPIVSSWGLVYSNGTQVTSNLYTIFGLGSSIIINPGSTDSCVSPCGCQTIGGHVVIFAKINPNTNEILGYYFRRTDNDALVDLTDQLIVSGNFGTWDGESQIVDANNNNDGTFTVTYDGGANLYQTVINGTSGVIVEPPSVVTDGPTTSFSMFPLSQEGQGRWAALWSNATGLFTRIFSQTDPSTTTTAPSSTSPPTTSTFGTTSSSTPPPSISTTNTASSSASSTLTTSAFSPTSTAAQSSSSSAHPTSFGGTSTTTHSDNGSTTALPVSQPNDSSNIVGPVIGVISGVICLAVTTVTAIFARRWFKSRSDDTDFDMPISRQDDAPTTVVNSTLPPPRAPGTDYASFGGVATNNAPKAGTQYQSFEPGSGLDESRVPSYLRRPPLPTSPSPPTRTRAQIPARRPVGPPVENPIYNNISDAVGLPVSEDDAPTEDPTYNNYSALVSAPNRPTTDPNYNNIDEAVRGAGVNLPTQSDPAVYVPFSALSGKLPAKGSTSHQSD